MTDEDYLRLVIESRAAQGLSMQLDPETLRSIERIIGRAK
jgi:hypothetical protein